MITELGHFALILAFVVACIQATVPLVGARKRWAGWMAVAEPAATLQFLLTAFSFLALTWAFVTSDFSLRLVWLNSHTAKPMLYKITGVWGNHEGSMLPLGIDRDALRGLCRVVRGQSATRAESAGAGRAGNGWRGLLRFYPLQLKPVPASGCAAL